ncbi:MAG: glycosyltransferase family 4 protein [Oscillospiraceae bacterium]|nr:glycosyltransferase family 4 protein [Oscillospiraceae bacterium]
MSQTAPLLFYINSLHRGGAQRVMVQLAGRFAAAGRRVILLTSYREADEYPVPDGVERLSIEDEQRRQDALRRNLSRIRALRELCRKERPAALIAFMAEPNFRAVLAARGLQVPVIVSVRNDPDREYAGKLFRFVGKHVLPEADFCVFQTERARAWFPEKLRKKSAVIMNQVDESFFDRPACSEPRDIVAVGRLTAQKDHALLIRAYAALGPVGDRLVIYGEGEKRAELEALVRELSLKGRVLLPGLSADIPRDIEGAKLFVLPSDYEGMPNALLEAMALGLACISTDCPCGGPAELIENDKNGLLVPVGDEAALTAAMARLLGDEAERASLGRTAREGAEAFRPEAVFRQWETCVQAVIDGKEHGA